MATNEELTRRVEAIEAHLAGLPVGMKRFVPGEAPAEAPKLTLYEEVTAGLNQEQLHALENAGLTTVAQLKKAAKDEDGLTRIDGIGPAADKKLRKALEGLANG